MDDSASTMESVKTCLSLFSEAVGLVKKTQDLLPDSVEKEAIEKSLAEAGKASKLAEAQIAQALGYRLCQCTFPPQVMLSVGYKENIEEFKCTLCNKSSIAPSIDVHIPATINAW
ncbi:hypothetical protein ORI98_04410 [Shewanella sp. ULN5]|uniref:hypothetical protein n=1 Tax=Shewanella sp. ULN5 TaxID=2994678 RepID=UPI00273FE497|nr:hypothetical protein [Shewanella sp. ULN5]MDP5145683.1 hypothetical protein [Shewanella sp. ULN5]